MDDFTCLRDLYEQSKSHEENEGYVFFEFDAFDGLELVIEHLESNKKFEAQIDNATHKISIKKHKIDGLYLKRTEYLSRIFSFLSGEDRELPSEIYIVEDRKEKSRLIRNSVNNLRSWMLLLKNISDHCEYDKDTRIPKYIFIVEDEKLKTIKKHFLELSIILKVDGLIESIPSPTNPAMEQDFSSLIKEMKNGDIHSAEKRLVLRSSIIDLIKSHKNSNNFITELFKKPHILWEYFSNQYEFYVRRFSLDKIKREIETEKLDYLKKINDQLQDHLSKSLIIPSIMVAIALVKSWSPESIIVIFFALLLSTVIVLLSLNTRKLVIKDIKDSAIDVLTLIEKTQNTENEKINTEIHGMVKNASGKVVNLANKALRNINFVFSTLILFICLLLIYSILSIISVNEMLTLINKGCEMLFDIIGILGYFLKCG